MRPRDGGKVFASHRRLIDEATIQMAESGLSREEFAILLCRPDHQVLVEVMRVTDNGLILSEYGYLSRIVDRERLCEVLKAHSEAALATFNSLAIGRIPVVVCTPSDTKVFSA